MINFYILKISKIHETLLCIMRDIVRKKYMYEDESAILMVSFNDMRLNAWLIFAGCFKKYSLNNLSLRPYFNFRSYFQVLSPQTGKETLAIRLPQEAGDHRRSMLHARSLKV